MTQQEYDKKMAVLEEARSKAFQAYREDCKVCNEACKAWLESCKAIDDLEESWAEQESWAKQESEAVK